ncbi:MAG TPA: cation:proton antiporter [Methylomirabilota bacterium]|nr:cation:proton antiporter [Methylomirabilota bacterium]
MATDPVFFHDLAWVIAAAVVGGALAWLARQPVILGYVVGGILVGRFTPGPTVSDTHMFELFAEIGVVLLMFSVGIEFSLRDLLRVRWVALLGGPLGIVLTAAMGAGAGALLGWPPGQGLAVGLVISVASTMVLVRLLMDRGELHTRHGRVMIGISLVEDLAVVAMISLMPALAVGVGERGSAVVYGIAKALLVLVPVLILAARVVPALMRRVARTQNDELFLLVVLAIGLGTGALTQAVGLSVALGAFLAGLIISTSDYAHETIARLLPLRDVFVAMFFVTVGMLVDPFSVAAKLPLLAAVILLVVVGKAVVRLVIVRLFGHPWSTAARVGLGLAQIGEFSFVLVQVARTSGLVGDDVYNVTLAASLLSILFNALLVQYVPDRLDAFWHAWTRGPSVREPAERAGVVLCGFGRVGSEIGEALQTFEIPYVVIERDPDICAQLRARGIPCVFGDAAHRDLLQHAGVGRAPLVIVALPAIERARLAVAAVRALRPDVPLLARAHGRNEAEALRAKGATEVIQPELEASATLIRHVLASLGLPKDRAIAYLERYRSAMERADAGRAATVALPEVRELALRPGGVADQSLRDARIRERFGVTVVAVRRADGLVLNPPPDTTLRAGDVVRVFGLPEQIEAFATEAAGR